MGRHADQVQIVICDRPAPRWRQPHNALECRRLACAIPSEQCHDLAMADLQTDALEYVRQSVVRVDVAYAQPAHMEPCKYTSWTRALLRTSSGVPSVSTDPKW